AHHTVTFTAPQPAHVLHPNASACGLLEIAPIGTRDEFCESNLHLAGPEDFSHLFTKRLPTAHKGDFGHVLVVGGAAGKTGAASMTGLAALRAGAGLVTVCSSGTMAVPELMTEPLGSWDQVKRISEGKSLLALGPGIGTDQALVELVRRAVAEIGLPIVVDADGLNALCGWLIPHRSGLILTPHPGEMSRLCGVTTAQVQSDRIGVARSYAVNHGLTLVLKGRNTLTAFPDGQVWVNPTGGPALATGGSGDILTGLIAGLAAQFPLDHQAAVLAAVWLHGRAGDLAAAKLGEKSVIATDLIHSLPEAMEECARLQNE
ncbi:MAG: NAD(P)H-hydrate dehydratase, partial [Acidobacteriia bacterium]|nr:NAD(P)H-hydrate dehydratase [Terriglobia bacterium]